jgi:hypothetical protein
MACVLTFSLGTLLEAKAPFLCMHEEVETTQELTQELLAINVEMQELVETV